MDDSKVDRFASAAEDYCAWCEGESKAGSSAARIALQHLARIYAMALDLNLPLEGDSDLQGERSSDAAWKSVFESCAGLPFSYYSEVFNPIEVPADGAVVGDLGDDLADIHRDLSSGLSSYRRGHSIEAELEWRRSFEVHWGRHAASALRALDCWFSEEGW